MPVRECNFLIVGTGIAGASAAYHLAGSSSVILLERESQPGYHSTGRSAAVYAESYGPRLMRVMIRSDQLVPSRHGVHWPHDSWAKNRQQLCR